MYQRQPVRLSDRRPNSVANDPNILSQFIEKLDDTNDIETVEVDFAAAVGKLGVDYYAYQIIRATGTRARLPCIISNYPEHWVRHYFAEGYLDDDPIIGEALRSRLPFLWSSVQNPEDLSRRQRQLVAEACEIGLNNGMTIPLTGHGVETAAASFVVGGASAEAEVFLRCNQHLLHLMALYFHAKVGAALLAASLAGTGMSRRSVLTAREREVLEWIARGKSAWEIALILCTTEKSIEYHVDGIKRKLQVFNRTHAVVKAIAMGLIVVSP